jgi:hypothetical protein
MIYSSNGNYMISITLYVLNTMIVARLEIVVVFCYGLVLGGNGKIVALVSRYVALVC